MSGTLRSACAARARSSLTADRHTLSAPLYFSMDDQRWCSAARESQHQVERRLLLDVVVRESAAVLELLASEDQALLVRRDALLVLDLGLDIFDGVRALYFQGDSLACQGLRGDAAVLACDRNGTIYA